MKEGGKHRSDSSHLLKFSSSHLHISHSTNHCFKIHTSVTRLCCLQFKCSSSGLSNVMFSLPSLINPSGIGNSLNCSNPFSYLVGFSRSPFARNSASPYPETRIR